MDNARRERMLTRTSAARGNLFAPHQALVRRAWGGATLLGLALWLGALAGAHPEVAGQPSFLVAYALALGFWIRRGPPEAARLAVARVRA